MSSAEPSDEEMKQAEHAAHLDAMGITQEEIDSSIKVLQALGSRMEAYHSRPLKLLRKALLPFIDDLRAKFPKEPNQYFRKKQQQQEVRKNAHAAVVIL